MLKLRTLEDVVHDTIQSREEIKLHIERLLQQPTQSQYTRQISEAKESLSRTQLAFQSERKHLQNGTTPNTPKTTLQPPQTPSIVYMVLMYAARKKVQSLKTSISLRKESMHKGLQSQAQSQNNLLDSRSHLSELKSTLTNLTLSILAQR